MFWLRNKKTIFCYTLLIKACTTIKKKMQGGGGEGSYTKNKVKYIQLNFSKRAKIQIKTYDTPPKYYQKHTVQSLYNTLLGVHKNGQCYK